MTGGVLETELRFALELADLAAELSLQPRPAGSGLVVTEKADGSPVTDVDRAVERTLRARLEACRPGHAVTGEELGDTGTSDWRWYLDPIDGTADYIAGGNAWTTLIALAHRDEPAVAVIAAPPLGRRWWAVRSGGAFRDGERLRVTGTARLSDATITDDWRGTLARGAEDHPLARLARSCGRIAPRRGHSFLRVAGGEIDVAVGMGGFVWDYMPLKLLVEEAGGRFTDLSGDPSPANRHALVSNGRLHEEALRAAGGPPSRSRSGPARS